MIFTTTLFVTRIESEHLCAGIRWSGSAACLSFSQSGYCLVSAALHANALIAEWATSNIVASFACADVSDELARLVQAGL